MRAFAVGFGVIISLFLGSCKEKDVIDNKEEIKTGKDSYLFSKDVSNLDKSVPVYVYIPEGVNENSRVVFVFHGASRNAVEYRDSWIEKSELYNAVIVAPKFSDNDFPGGDGYNLGNVYKDGDNPSVSTLNPEDKWVFSIVEPLFDFINKKYYLNNSSYFIYGHSAGSQVAHRFLKFIDSARVEKAVLSASGWYTAFDNGVNFPYGLNNSILAGKDYNIILNKKVFVQVGEKDTDENDPSLRHNKYADAQGMNRVERANFYFNNAKKYSADNNIDFNWEFSMVPGVGHEFAPMSENAAELMFN